VSALVVSLALCVVVVFVIGAVKTRWTKRNPVRSGLEVVGLAAFAGIAGYLFGSALPSWLGFAGLGPM
jgi:VIT1/CCC1 family predicted Fe2+/Mn2+ transporter